LIEDESLRVHSFPEIVNLYQSNAKIIALPVKCFRVSKFIFTYVKQLDERSRLHYFSELPNDGHHIVFRHVIRYLLYTCGNNILAFISGYIDKLKKNTYIFF